MGSAIVGLTDGATRASAYEEVQIAQRLNQCTAIGRIDYANTWAMLVGKNGLALPKRRITRQRQIARERR